MMACVERQVCPYPPGIPVLLPGERVTASAVRELREFRRASIKACACGSSVPFGCVLLAFICHRHRQ